MSETVSVLFAVPVDRVDSPAATETLRSIRSQTYPESMVKVHTVHYVADSPEAHTSALNAAREMARNADDAGFVGYAEPGILWEPRKLERQVLSLQGRPGAGACVHPMTVRLESGRSWRFDLSHTSRYGPRIASFLRPPWGPGAALATSEAAGRVGVFRNVEQVLWEHAVRMSLRLAAVALLDEDLAVWNPGTGSDPVAVSGKTPPRPLVSDSAQEPRYPFLTSHLQRLTTEALFTGQAVASPSAAAEVHAGLHAHAGDVDGARERLSQSSEASTSERPYWESVLHRARGDSDAAEEALAGRRSPGVDAAMRDDVTAFLQGAIQLPDYGEGRDTAARLLRYLQDGAGWNGAYWSRLCREALGEGRRDVIGLLEEIQQIEFNVLLDRSFHRAIGAEAFGESGEEGIREVGGNGRGT